MSDETHPNDLELAAFLDGGLDAEARHRVEAHLLACDDCRGLVTAAGRLLSPPARRTLRRVLVVGGLAAAAGLLLTVVPGPVGREPLSRTRDGETPAPSGLSFAPQAPPDGALVRADTLVFHWTRVAGEATYQITVSTETGAVVWTQQTSDTSLALPAIVTSRLQAKRIYYWQVEALLPDLRSASTPPRRFTPLVP